MGHGESDMRRVEKWMTKHTNGESPLLVNPFTATTSRVERADPRHTSISCQFGMMRSLGSDMERDAAATTPAGVTSCPENGCLLLLGFLTSLGRSCYHFWRMAMD